MNPRLPLLFLGLAAAASLRAVEPPLPEKVEFNRDVRPILADKCFKCHGFDPKTREADRRLDNRAGALADLDGIRAIVPGNLAESDLHVRIHSTDKDEMMPSPKAGKKLTGRERAMLDRWIEQGAEYQPHWAYAPVTRPSVPDVEEPAFVKNPIDALVRARQKALGLMPAAEAEWATLLRRVHLDLTGLPPAPEVVAQLRDAAGSGAYERTVDALLASPAYGERMAVFWLDLVRYADSIGYHSDNSRNVSPYRDYVIRAFRENKRFDEFTIEQLAGDLLPNATLTQRVASGYNRLNLTTEEGGAQARDYEQRTVADRVRSIGTTWLAQTTGCAQCHDHKFDPITTRDFYRLGAFFADIKESSIGKREDGVPVPTAEQEAQLKAFEAQLGALRARLDAPSADLDAAQTRWEERTRADLDARDQWVPLTPVEMRSEKGSVLTAEAGAVLRAAEGSGEAEIYRITIHPTADLITGFRLEALASSRLPNRGPGRSDGGNFVLTEFTAEVPGQGSIALAQATATFEQGGHPAKAAIDGKTGDRGNGWAISGGIGMDQTIYFQLAQPLIREGGGPITLTLRFDYGGHHALGKFRISVTSAAGAIVPFDGKLPAEIVALLAIEPTRRDDTQGKRLREHFRSIEPSLAPLRQEIAQAAKERETFDGTIARSLVAESMGTPRLVRILPRGNWQDESGEVVEPGVPEFLPQPNVEGRRLTRLDLAHWLMARENPLTARVFVNRLWKLFFGTGLSKVLDDVGAQGELPSNLALLDWLAAEFIESGWNVQHVVRLIVTSGTYRQSSSAPRELLQRDPEGRELTRQSRFRLDAEFVRDNALAISGLLVSRVGGASAKPYQPAGYWENLNFPTREWEASQDDNQWRRGLYTWWQRSYLHPSLLAFDAPTREECTAERVRSNIPQQALVLLNDPTYVEAARAFAMRMLREGGNDVAARLTWACRVALARDPRPDEIATLAALLGKHRVLFANDPGAAEALLKTGLAPLPADLPPPHELAAWTSVARVVLNLHETITRF